MCDMVRLEIPACAQYIVMARLVAAAIAGQAGFDVDRIEDFKTAVAEACLMLLPGTKDAKISLALWADAGAHARIHAPLPEQDIPETPERAFSGFLLDALVDEAIRKQENGCGVYELHAMAEKN